MSALADYILEHTTAAFALTPLGPAGETTRVVDVCFFNVGVDDSASADRLRELLSQHVSEYDPDDKLDLSQPGEYSYIQLGAWLGSQELALRLIGMGTALGLWNLLSPKIFAQIFDLSKEQIQDLAEKGYVTAFVPRLEKAVSQT